jgi:hypothetical protein
MPRFRICHCVDLNAEDEDTAYTRSKEVLESGMTDVEELAEITYTAEELDDDDDDDEEDDNDDDEEGDDPDGEDD